MGKYLFNELFPVVKKKKKTQRTLPSYVACLHLVGPGLRCPQAATVSEL